MRTLAYLDWIKERNEASDSFRHILKKLDRSSYLYLKATHRYAPSAPFVYSDSTNLTYWKMLEEKGIIYAYSTYFVMDTEPVLVQYPDDEEVEEWVGQIEEDVIQTVRYITIKELRDMTGFSQQNFGNLFLIPLRTIQNWEASVSSCPEFALPLMCEKVHKMLQAASE